MEIGLIDGEYRVEGAITTISFYAFFIIGMGNIATIHTGLPFK